MKSQTRVSLFHLPMNYPGILSPALHCFTSVSQTVQAVLQEVKDAEGRVVLFIDEAWRERFGAMAIRIPH